MQRKSRKICMILLVGIMLVLSGCGKSVEEKMDAYLTEGDFENIVTLYNEKIAGDQTLEDEYNEKISEFINEEMIAWMEQENDSDEAVEVLETFKEIKNEDLMSLAENDINEIQTEERGKELHQKAEAEYAASEFFETMKTTLEIPKEYSQYESAQELYDDAAEAIVVMSQSADSKSDYQEEIEKFKGYINEIHDSKLEKRKDEMEEELSVLEEIDGVVNDACTAYNSGSYKEAFFSLENESVKYPGNEKLTNALDVLHEMYTVKVYQEVQSAMDDGEYEKAAELIHTATSNYKSDEMFELQEYVDKRQTLWGRWTTAASEKVEDAITVLSSIANKEKLAVKEEGGVNYVLKSGKKMVLGDYTDDDVTMLSFAGNIVASIVDVDLLMDIRDLSYDVTHWGEEDYFVVYLAADMVALLPVVGVVKYFKYTDDVAKGGKITSEIIDEMSDTAKLADQATEVTNSITDAGKQADNIEDAIKISDTATDAVKDADAATDAVKNVDTAADEAKDVDKAADAAKDTVKHYEHIATKNEKLVGSTHPETGVPFVKKELEFSDGRRIEGVFAQFESKLDVKLPEDYYKASFNDQKKYLLDTLKQEIEDGNKNIISRFTEDELADILDGIIPDGYVWHHSEEEGVMQLVDEAKHAATGHTGGMSLWGRGYD